MISQCIRHGVLNMRRHMPQKRSFFLFLIASFFLVSAVDVFFGSLRDNQETYYARRITGYGTIIRAGYTGFRTRYPPPASCLFDPRQVIPALERLRIPYSPRLRFSALLYADDSDTLDLQNPVRAVIAIGADPGRESALLTAMSLSGRLPRPDSHEALTVGDPLYSPGEPKSYIIQRLTPSGIPVYDRITVVGNLEPGDADPYMYSDLLFLTSAAAGEICWQENGEVSDIMIGKTSLLQRAALRARLGGRFTLVGYQDSDDIVQAISLVARSLHAVCLFFILCILLAALNGNITLSMINHRMEIGIYRSFGYSDGVITLIIGMEYLALCLCAAVPGCLLTVLFSLIFNAVGIQAINIDLEIAFSGRALAMHPSAAPFLSSFLLLTLPTLALAAFRAGRFLREEKLTGIMR
jgi:hypothetical protein